MGKKYKNPPVVEALCEFQFIQSAPWDLTIPGLIYERIKEDFPEKIQHSGMVFQMFPTEKGIEPKIELVPTRIQFSNEEKTAFVQLAPDLFVVNQLKPYPGWDNLNLLIRKNFKTYIEIAKPKGLKRIGLRYINVFEFTSQNLKSEEYFNYYPSIPKNMTNLLNSFLIKTEFLYNNKKENLTLQLGSIIPSKPDVSSIVLDIEYATISTEHVTFNNIEEWIEKAHEEIEVSFETVIKDNIRELFMKGEE